MLDSKIPVELTPARQKTAERDTILSACTGALGDVVLSDSAIIILYAVMLGAGDMFSMVTTAIFPLFNGICIIPMAWLSTKLGIHRMIVKVSILSFLVYLLIVAAPFFGTASVAVMVGSLIFFAFFHTGYAACWFPLLDSFLTKERRGIYLGKMRFCWQLSSSSFILLVGFVIGKNPPLSYLQIVLFVAAIIFLGRIIFLSRIPVFELQKKEKFNFKVGLATALANKPLTGFSAYLFALNIAAYGTIPLTIIYLKRHLEAPHNIIIIISAVTLIGMLIGSLFSGKIIQRYGTKKTLLGIHIVYAMANGAIFFIGKDTLPPTFTYIIIAFLLLIYSFTFANANVVSTSEMMALATPGNKTMAMAFCGTFYYSGSGLARLISSLILGSGILAPQWTIGSVSFCHYQTLFMIYSIAIVFAAMFLVVVPAIFPKGEYSYSIAEV